MTINDLEFFLVELPSAGAGTVRSVLVRVTADTGLEGWGEGRLPWRASELAARRAVLLPALVGRSIFDIEELLTLEVLRVAALRCALETACWDLVGRATRQPLCHLFGGYYRRQVPLAVRLSGDSPQALGERSRELADRGFPTQILPSCGSLEGDVARATAVREMAGPRVELRLDGAGQYDLQTARDLCTELERLGLEFLIDPLRSNDLDELAALRRQVNVPLAAWRAIEGPRDVLALVRSGAAPCVVVDPQRVGGLVPARKCASVAEAAGLAASLGTEPSAGVCAAAMVQLAAATPALTHANQCAHDLAFQDLLGRQLAVADGMIIVPNGPGLGMDIDRARLERYQLT